MWIALPAVPGDMGDDSLLILGESRQFCIADQIIGVPVMGAVGNEPAAFLQQRSRLKRFAFFFAGIRPPSRLQRQG
jgi:hypothetical protein